MSNKNIFSPPKSGKSSNRLLRYKISSQKKKEHKKEYILELLSKMRTSRTRVENKIIADYLSSKVAFFSKLNNPTDLVKLERLIGVLNYEIYPKDQNIISFGEEGDKFYVLIEGLVGVYKPSYISKTMKLRDYLDLMNNIRDIQGNKPKFNRINEKNAPNGLDIDFYSKIHPDSYALKKDYIVVIEEDEKLAEFTEPFAFGDIALIKRCQRNATIRALNDTKVVSIDKYDYNKIIGELEEKRLETQLREFRKGYPLFQYWSLNQLIRLFNCFSKQNLTKGDYLYKQNEVSDSIYVIKSGVFEMYSLLSFGWVNEFFDYIIESKQNLIYSLGKGDIPIKESELIDYYDKLIRESIDSPCVLSQHKKPKAIPAYETKEEIHLIRAEHEEMINPDNLFRVNCRLIDSREVIGIEDAFEIKRRFCFVRCVSKQAEVERINVFDFIKLINVNRLKNINSNRSSSGGGEKDDEKYSDNKNRHLLLDMIAKRKFFIFTQLKNGTIQRNKALSIKLNHRFHNLSDLKPNEETKLVVMKLKDKDLFDYPTYKKSIINALSSPKIQPKTKQNSHRISMVESSSLNNINHTQEPDIKALAYSYSRNYNNSLRKIKISKGYSTSRNVVKRPPRIKTFKYTPFICITRFNKLVDQLSNEKGQTEECYNKQRSTTKDSKPELMEPMENIKSNSLPRNIEIFKYLEYGNNTKESRKENDGINDLKQSLSRNNKQFFLSNDYNTSSQRILKTKSLTTYKTCN